MSALCASPLRRPAPTPRVHRRVRRDSMPAATRVAIVGSGLAGLAAALEVAETGGEAVVFETAASLGGNSVKASSGLSAVTPESGDDAASFESDFLRAAGGEGANCNPEHVRDLVQSSEDALRFLARHGVLLPSLTQCGGHSHVRTHKNAAGPNVGVAIMSPLVERARAHPGITIRSSCRVTRVLRDEACGGGCGAVCGAVSYTHLTLPTKRIV